MQIIPSTQEKYAPHVQRYEQHRTGDTCQAGFWLTGECVPATPEQRYAAGPHHLANIVLTQREFS